MSVVIKRGNLMMVDQKSLTNLKIEHFIGSENFKIVIEQLLLIIYFQRSLWTSHNIAHPEQPRVYRAVVFLLYKILIKFKYVSCTFFVLKYSSLHLIRLKNKSKNYKLEILHYSMNLNTKVLTPNENRRQSTLNSENRT